MRSRERPHDLNLRLRNNGRLSTCNFWNIRGQHGFSACDHILGDEFPSDKFSIIKSLSFCCKAKNLVKGKCLHFFAVILGSDSDTFVATAILSLYGRCGTFEDAFTIFYRLREKDVVSWNAIISAAARRGSGAECLRLFDDMRQTCVLADKFTIVSMLSACAAMENIKSGQYIHAQLVSEEEWRKVVLGTALLRMYCKCRNVKYARRVFDEMDYHDEISWNTMISGYSELGYSENAFRLFHKMLQEGLLPNTVTFLIILDASTALCDVLLLHSWLVETGLKLDVVLGSALVDAYCSYSCMHDAHDVFDSLSERNLITWNCLIAGYTATKKLEEALIKLHSMQYEGFNADEITWSNVLNACADVESLGVGHGIYNEIVILGLEDENTIVASAIKLYSKSDCSEIVQILFQRVSWKDFLLWNTVIMINAQYGFLGEACELFHEMHKSGVLPDCQILSDLLGACANCAALLEGRFLHSVAIFLNFDLDILVANALINMYGDCSCLEDAWCLFERMRERSGIFLTSIAGVYGNFGNSAHAMYLYAEMERNKGLLDKATLLKLLNTCSMEACKFNGQKLHKEITLRGYDGDCVVANALINMYGNCGALLDSEKVFESLQNKDSFSWNIMMTTYAKQNMLTQVFCCLYQMELDGLHPDEITFVSILSKLPWNVTVVGIGLIHGLAVCEGFESIHAVVASLIHCFAKLGMMKEALCLFDKLAPENVVVWNWVIKGHVEQGKAIEAFQLFSQMQMEGFLAEKSSYFCILDGFTDVDSLLCGKHLHACCHSHGFLQDVVLNTAFISFYGRCYNLGSACQVFNSMPEKDEICWSALVQASFRNGAYAETLQLFEQMQKEAFIPNVTCFLSLLGVCPECSALHDGLKFHARLLHNPHVLDINMMNAVLNMYGKFGNICDVERNFIAMQKRDVISFNIMIRCLLHCQRCFEALQTFLQMLVEGFTPDAVTLASAFESCSNLGDYFQGKLVHTLAIFSGKLHAPLENAAISMYSKCGYLQMSLKAFDHISEKDILTWNSIISAVCSWDVDVKAFELFATMVQEIRPDAATFVIVLCLCSNKGALMEGRLLHSFIASLGYENEVMIGNSLINLYGTCDSSADAEKVFESLAVINTATWNAMVTSGTLQGTKKLYLIEEMQRNSICPNEITYAIILDFCAENNFLEGGRIIYINIILSGFELNVNLATSLINFYGKCGMIIDARSVFENSSFKNLFTWTAMIAAYGSCGFVKEATVLLEQMQHKNVGVDKVTLVSVLSSCAQNGSMERGQCLLFEMFHNAIVELEHFTCMIDLLGRSGQLTEAESMIWNMPLQPTAISWTSLVAACLTVGDPHVADRAVACISELNFKYFEDCI